MKIGDLVTLAWGEHPRRVGMVTAIRRFNEARVKWFGADGADEEHYLLRCLELASENR